LRAEHFGDTLHPNDLGARIIAEVVFQVLPKEYYAY
jgi:lysophospholipase L1-like esterase